MPATAHALELTSMWTTVVSCLHCQHEDTTETLVSQFHWDLHPSDSASTVTDLLQSTCDVEDVAEASRCSACGQCRCRVRRRGQLLGMGEVLLLRVVRERWSKTRNKFDHMDSRPVVPEPFLILHKRTYRLRAVLVHRGYDPRSGHYLCAVPLDTDNNQWRLYNDGVCLYKKQPAVAQTASTACIYEHGERQLAH